MRQTDNDFFEEYKRLDRLCADMYSCRNGVSEYIAQMENRFYQGQFRVPSWSSDHKMLKHVRWVRNQIAHDSGAYQISEPEDLEFVFSGQDPLTLLRKATEAEAERRKRQARSTTSTPPDNESTGKLLGIVIGIGIVALVLTIIFAAILLRRL